jgi:hypothetical protein
VRRLAFGLFTLFVLALADCGGSSSETPPPLEPSPVNIHYNRSATTLPGEVTASPKPVASALDEPASAELPANAPPAKTPPAKTPPAKTPLPASNF